MDTITPDLIDNKYRPKLQRFYDAFLADANAGKPMMHHYFQHYYDLYWDLHVAATGKDIPSEVRPLVSAINKALDRLDEGFRLQRDFTADAAHELRTPLSILRTRVETLDDPRVAQALVMDIEAMSRVIGQLLDIAELEGFELDPAEVADLQGASAEIAGFVAPLALAGLAACGCR